MKKRIVQVLSLLGGTAIALAFFFLTDKVILGVREADAKVNAYEEAHNMHPEEIRMKYDWYSGGGYISDNYNYNQDKDIIFDKEYNELWKKFFDEKMEAIEASMYTNVLMEDYNLITYFDGTEVNDRYDDLFIYGVYNTEPVAEEKRIETGAEIIMDIISQMGYNYNFCGVHIDYYDLEGVLRFSVALNKQTITKEILMNSATVVSFEKNLAIQEKWEAFCDQRVTFWTLPVEEYEISLKGMEEYGDYQLILRDGEEEKVWKTVSRCETGNPREEYEYGTFDNILGYSGFYIFEMHHLSSGDFYVIDDGDVICIAHTWGNSLGDCHSVDVNQNGIPELICSVRYGDGAEDTIIYENNMSQILSGSGCDLLDVEFDNIGYWTLGAWYVPEKEVIHIYYWLESLQDFDSKEYAIDLDEINFYPYAEVEGVEIKVTDPNSSDDVNLDEMVDIEKEDRKAAYISALEKIVYQQASPDDTANENWFYGDNEFAIYDLNLDGEEELLIKHDSGIESDSKLFIYEYNDKTKEFRKIFREYPAITFYENGMIKAEASHNQTEKEFWPYSLYHIDEETGTYKAFVYVDSAEEDTKVYEKYLAGVEIIEIPFVDLPIVRPEAAG